MDGFRTSFGERLAMLRENRMMERKDVCRLAGVSPTAYAYYERGMSEPTANVIVRLCHAFGVSADVLLGLEDGC